MYLVEVKTLGEKWEVVDYYMENGWIHMLFADESWLHIQRDGYNVSSAYYEPEIVDAQL